MWRSFEQLFPSNLIYFGWLLRILHKGYSSPLSQDDVESIPTYQNNSQTLNTLFFRKWSQELRKRPKPESRPLLRAVLLSFRWIIIACAIVRLIDTCLLLTLERLCLGQILQGLVQEGSGSVAQLKTAAVAFTIFSLLRLILGGFYYFILEVVGRQIRIGLTSLVNSKVLRLGRKSLREVCAGDIVNLISNDGAKLENSYEILTVFIGPFQLCSLGWIVWKHFGWSSLSGIATITLLGIAQSRMGQIGSDYRTKVAAASARRVKLVTQIVSAIRTIKMYGWELPFSKLVGVARENELKLIHESHVLRTLGWCMYSCTATVAMFSTIIVYLGSGNTLTVEKVFVCSTIYQNIGMVLNVDFPKGLAQLGIFITTISRFQDFLLLYEIDHKKQNTDLSFGNQEPARIVAENASLAFTRSQMLLSDINLSIESPELVVVVGSVGSGKTTLVNMILKELPLYSGKLDVSGRLAYVPQQAWLFHGTIRENILFGNPFDRTRYDNVIHSCALGRDFNFLPQGDATVVAEGGLSLSGGQKARISLARAAYSQADIYLLDDTLSAVDQKVGEHIIRSCINGILRNKLRILVTHQVYFLTDTTRVVRIEEGRIVPSDVEKFEKFAKCSPTTEPVAECDDDEAVMRLSNAKYFDELNSNVLSASEISSTQSGKIPFKIYVNYFTAMPNSCKYLLIFLLASTIAQITQSGETYFLKFSVTSTADGFSSWDYSAQFLALTVVILLVIVTAALHSSCFLKIIHLSGATIYDAMFQALIGAKISFFTTHSSGHIIERFARDTFVLDEIFPFTIFYAVHILQKYVMSLTLFVGSFLNILMLVPILFLFAGVYYLQQIQIRTCRSLNELEVTAKEPILSRLNSTFQGLATIRAFKKIREIEKRFNRSLDLYFWTNLTKLSVICLTSAAIDFLSLTVVNLFIIFATIRSTSSQNSDFAYAIAPLIALTSAIGWATSQFHVVETQAKSVDCILKFVAIESEEMPEVTLSPPPDWPWKGRIIFEGVSLSYTPQKEVLKNVSFNILSGEKIGIIGRTGSGKSSLVAALFRLPEASGKILIDGINIREIALSNLRHRISIIPQDPVLFEGTVQSNLDLFGQYGVKELLNALQNVNLLRRLGRNNKNVLEFKIQEGGVNLSVGERQLICMARALLRKNKILILDEATASIDGRTGRIIQNKIRKIFKDCTVLTIQHRLSFILDYDKILVMDEGEVIEFDAPHKLLQNPKSYLSQRISQIPWK